MKRLAVLLALLLCSCEPPIKSGVVTDRIFTRAHSERYQTPEMEYNWYSGEYETVWKWKTRHVPDKFEIRIKGKNEEGRERTRAITVTEYEYNQSRLGECWPPLKPVE